MRTGPLLLALAVAGCASAVSGTGSAPSAPTPLGSSHESVATGRPAPTASATASPPALTPAALGGRLRAAARRQRSAHVEVDSGGLAGRADELLSGGAVTAVHITQDSGAGITYEVIAVGRRAWVRLPAFYATHARWVVVARSSPVTPARNLARSLPSVRAAAAPLTAAGYVSAATSVRLLGTRSVGGVATTAYAVVVETRRLPPGSPLRDRLAAAGADRVTVEVDVDAADRLARLAAPGSSVAWSHLDEPVRISPPPAGQTGRS